jgi:hypothetical protein
MRDENQQKQENVRMKRVLSSEPWMWICLHPCRLVNNLLRLHQFRIHCLPGLVEEIDFYLGHPGAQGGVAWHLGRAL